MAMIYNLLILVNRYIKNSLRAPFFIMMAISQPLMYLLLFGSLFSNIHIMNSNNYTYIEFLTPGMIILASMFSSAYLGMNVLQDIKQDFFDRLIISAPNVIAIPLSYVLGNLFTIFLITLILAIVGMIFGGFPPGGITSLIYVVMAAFLISIAFASLSCVIAYLTKMQEPILGIMNFVTLPLMFTSNMMLTSELMPNWIKHFSHYNPITWAVSISQQAYLYNSQHTFIQNFSFLICFCFISLGLMILAYRKFIGNN